jgi:signal transduction histidine kinase/ActR/RegA family two-component response regulator
MMPPAFEDTMTNILDWLISSPGFMPHGHCYLWQPDTLWLNVGSDGLIAASYFAIPLSLYYFVRRRRSDINFPWLLLMFAAFIFLCGSTHLMEIWTVWNPDYRLAGALKLLTGLVSLATALALFRLAPTAMKLRTPRQLQEQVRARTAELAELNSRLHEEIAARDRAHAQLRELDARKDEFLATLAHELRNPLAPVLNAVKILGMDGTGEQRQRWGREVIARQATRMGLLLDDLLNVSRITRGRLDLKPETVGLESLVSMAVETSAPLIEAKRHTLAVTLGAATDIHADPLRLSQALSNLLTNAAKFTPPGGNIRLETRLQAQFLDIAVSDDGAGFDPQAAPQLFEMFSQAHRASGADGLGIGLALVKGLAELHGGSVHAESPGVGMGATFTIRLPRSLLREPGVERVPDIGAAAREARGPVADRRGRVLVADDNRDAADSLALALEASGHQVWATHSGGQALDVARRERPDVLILDIGMPDVDGYELARLIRAEPWGSHAALVAMTGWGQPQDKERARAAGFDVHLTKPVQPDEVDRVLAGFLQAHGS